MVPKLSGDIPYGYCQCGCGEKTLPAKRPRPGIKRGEPNLYLAEHTGRARKVTDPVERFWSKVNKTETCWLWTDALDGCGYGRMAMGSRTTTTYRVSAHRYAYELLVGDIPEGLELDHLCRVRHCVNPDHLEPVTHLVNIMRGESPVSHNGEKTHCPQGHEYSEENTRWYTRPGADRPGRYCRECARADNKTDLTHPSLRNHCKYGHDITPGHPNTRSFIDPRSGNVHRSCRTCAREAMRAHRERKKMQGSD